MTLALPLKYLVDATRPITYGIVQAGPDTPGGVPYIRPVDMTSSQGVPDVGALQRTTASIAAAYRRSTIAAGDIVVSIGPSYGKIMVVSASLAGANLTQGTARVAPARGVEARFLYWALQSQLARQHWDVSVGGATFRALNLEPLARTPVPLLPRDEQRRIADFLDDQVAILDRAISLRQQQAGLLAERAYARTYAAVTGTNETGHRVSSTTAWIGSLPASWTVQPLGRLFDIQLGKMLAPDRVAGEYLRPYLRNTNVQWDRIDTHDLNQMNFAPSERQRYEVLPGDLLVCEGGEVGRAAIWDGSVAEMYYQKALHRLRRTADVGPRWVYYVLRVATRLGVFATGGTATIAHLTGEQLREQRMPFPPKPVEDRLVAQLDAESMQEASLLRLYEQQIGLLKERKQALITAAVTGEFDVTAAGKVLTNV